MMAAVANRFRRHKSRQRNNATEQQRLQQQRRRLCYRGFLILIVFVAVLSIKLCRDGWNKIVDDEEESSMTTLLLDNHYLQFDKQQAQKQQQQSTSSTAASISVSSIHFKKPPPPTYPESTFDSCCHLLRANDTIYQYGRDWDAAPVVIPQYKLLFFTIPKVSCTVFKQLFRRMAGYTDWQQETHPLPHAPTRNGLQYLYDYPPHAAQAMLTDATWTRAIFVRNPHERLLSAYLDKGRNPTYMQNHCCRVTSLQQVLRCNNDDDNTPWSLSFFDFLTHIVPNCQDKHWKSQADRIPQKFWPFVDFVGHFETLAVDARRLLESLHNNHHHQTRDAWEVYGASGWPPNGEAMFAETNVRHATNAAKLVQKYYNDTTIRQAVQPLVQREYQMKLFD